MNKELVAAVALASFKATEESLSVVIRDMSSVVLSQEEDEDTKDMCYFTLLDALQPHMTKEQYEVIAGINKYDIVDDHAYDTLELRDCVDLQKMVQKQIKDLSFENINTITNDGSFYQELLGPQSISDFNYLGCSAGGDWQYPVYFIIYQNKDSLRVYIPKDGNVFDTKTNMTYDTGDDDADGIFDKDKIIADIKKRFAL